MNPAPIDYAPRTDAKRFRIPGFSITACLALAIPISLLYLFIEVYIPRIEVIFTDYGVKLPKSTQWLLDIAWLGQLNGYLRAACVPLAAGFIVPLFYRLRPQLKRRSTLIIIMLVLNALLLAVLVTVMTLLVEPLINLLRTINP